MDCIARSHRTDDLVKETSTSSVIVLTICIGIVAYYTYKYMNRNKENVSVHDYHAKKY